MQIRSRITWRLSAKMQSMRFQFSLATLLVCMTVLAVVIAICAAIPVTDFVNTEDPFALAMEIHRSPTLGEMAFRVSTWGVLAIANTIAALWTISRLKSGRHTEPPVG
jgi:hypothetical protein